MSSEVSQLASRTVALKKPEKANQIISHFETSKTASMIKDIHQFNLPRIQLERDLKVKQEEMEAANVKLNSVLE